MWSVGKKRNRTTPPRQDSEAGFTLLELLVVIAIMAMAYAVAVPVFSRLMPSVTLNATAEGLVADLRRARMQSILSGKAVIFELPEGGGGYRVAALGLDKDPSGMSFGFQAQGRREIYFTPDGKNDGFTLWVRTAGRERKITSDWITGRITLMEAE